MTGNRTTSYRRQRHRHASVLVLMVPLCFAFFALAALVIDLGLVRTTQQRMSVACDTAALETMRWRDETPGDASPDTTPAGPGTRDANRREAASAIADNFFSNPPADDPSSTENAPFDAGPQFDVQAGANDQATILPSAVGYRPHLRSNVARNDRAGDMVAGSYHATATHRDVTDADRADLAVAGDPNAAADAPATLVRLRRLRANLAAAEDADVSSIGPALPLLFGRGSVIQGTQSADAFSIRRDGFSIRAAAIATATPAVAVCPGQVVPGIDGTTSLTLQGGQPIALSVDFWNTLPAVASDGTATPTAALADSNGTLNSNGAAVGHLWQAAPTTATGWTTIGIAIAGIAPASAGNPVLTTVTQGYVAIYETISDGQPTPTLTERIVGFGYARWDPTTQTITKLSQIGYNATTQTYTAAKGYVAPTNATADLSAAWQTLGLITQPAEVQQILLANARVAGPVSAATLVRGVGD